MLHCTAAVQSAIFLSAKYTRALEFGGVQAVFAGAEWMQDWGSRAQTARKIFSHRAIILVVFTYLCKFVRADFTARFGQDLSLSVTQSAFASTERSAALLFRRMRWCHRDHTPLITRVGYLPALSPCRPGESVMTLVTHSGLSLLNESYIKAPTATSNC